MSRPSGRQLPSPPIDELKHPSDKMTKSRDDSDEVLPSFPGPAVSPPRYERFHGKDRFTIQGIMTQVKDVMGRRPSGTNLSTLYDQGDKHIKEKASEKGHKASQSLSAVGAISSTPVPSTSRTVSFSRSTPPMNGSTHTQTNHTRTMSEGNVQNPLPALPRYDANDGHSSATSSTVSLDSQLNTERTPSADTAKFNDGWQASSTDSCIDHAIASSRREGDMRDHGWNRRNVEESFFVERVVIQS